MLLSSAAITAGAHAQTLPSTPSTDGLPTGGVEVGTGPDGVKLGADAGDTGGVTVGVGPGGVDLGLRTTPKPTPGSNAPPAAPGESGSAGGGSSEQPRSGSPGRSGPVGRGDSNGPAGDTAGSDGARRAGASRAGSDGRSGGTPSVDDLRSAAKADRNDRDGVAPVFDLIERIPAAVRAGLAALALIAVAMWALWVRGRRRLEHNAYVDPDTEVGNMAAFDQLLDSEWQRASRYQRPLGLLLLELEQRGSGGVRRLGAGEAKGAADYIGREVRQSDTVARLSPSRFAVICPEAPQGSVETLAHAIEHRLEERRLRCWASFSERTETDDRPADLVARAAAGLARVQHEQPAHGDPEQYPAPAMSGLNGAGSSASAL